MLKNSGVLGKFMLQLNNLQQSSQEEIANISNLQALDELRVKYLGKNGLVTQEMKNIASLSPEERKEFGAAVNKIKNSITEAIENKKNLLEQAYLSEKLQKEKMDITLPIRMEKNGNIHLISKVLEEVGDIFSYLGFKTEQGPQIEDDFHNFTALNIPDNHPARQMQDTFYLNAMDQHNKPLLLRTHTSSVQIRTLTNNKPPFKFIAPGRVYRSDYDTTHTPMFHQIEGMHIDKNVHMGHLKGVLQEFLKIFFEVDNVPIRFRPSFFPFTEPSAEVDIGCSRSSDGVKIGEGSDWLEILGCGMVHSNVLKNVDINPDEYQGYAFGIGIERLAMLKYGAPDLRDFFDSDIRWLRHYGF